jgi:DNA-binding transcriptional LysR family regulator
MGVRISEKRRVKGNLPRDPRTQGSGDVQLASTFLEIITSGSFVGAAERLGISQAAVSMRIQSLEAQLGCTLFARGRGGAKLTAAGHKFQRYAITMKEVWDQAQLELALPSGFVGQVRLGGHYSLWRHFLLQWLRWMRVHGQAYALRTEAHSGETLMRLLGDRMLDVGVVFDPQHLAGFTIERLFEETLVLVATEPGASGPADSPYIFIDWGPEFQKFHVRHFPDAALPSVQTNLGSFALEYLLEQGGAGYFPEPVVRSYLRDGRLHLVADAPRYDTPIYAVYREREVDPAVHIALDGLRATARQ